MDMSSLFASFLFSVLGFAAWRVGRVQQSMARMFLGVALMGFSYVTPSAAWTWGIGVILCGLVALVR